MEKIKSSEEIAKGQRRNKIIVGVVLIFLMVFSTAGFALFGRSNSSSGNSGDNNQQSSYYNGQYWVYNSGGQEFYFTNAQELAQKVPVSISLTLQNYAGGLIFVDSENDLIVNEISINLGRFTERLQRACYGPCEEDLPEKDCTENLIIFTESEENKVYQEENCVFIEGNLVSVDAFLYKILGLI